MFGDSPVDYMTEEEIKALDDRHRREAAVQDGEPWRLAWVPFVPIVLIPESFREGTKVMWTTHAFGPQGRFVTLHGPATWVEPFKARTDDGQDVDLFKVDRVLRIDWDKFFERYGRPRSRYVSERGRGDPPALRR